MMDAKRSLTQRTNFQLKLHPAPSPADVNTTKLHIDITSKHANLVPTMISDNLCACVQGDLRSCTTLGITLKDAFTKIFQVKGKIQWTHTSIKTSPKEISTKNDVNITQFYVLSQHRHSMGELVKTL